MDMTDSLLLLAQQVPSPRSAWAPIVLMIVIGLAFAVGTIVMSVLVGPKRTGSVKERVYESGMVPMGDARRRFNVRFFVVAMIFLVFDVAVVFFYPWARIFPDAVASGIRVPGGMHLSTLLLVEMLVFVAIVLVAYFYAWGKGVFRWD
jgi:NADH-quinone oxidoreductase subunit A